MPLTEYSLYLALKNHTLTGGILWVWLSNIWTLLLMRVLCQCRTASILRGAGGHLRDGPLGAQSLW